MLALAPGAATGVPDRWLAAIDFEPETARDRSRPPATVHDRLNATSGEPFVARRWLTASNLGRNSMRFGLVHLRAPGIDGSEPTPSTAALLAAGLTPCQQPRGFAGQTPADA